MGEKSKKRGDFGENIVEKILNLIGWSDPLKNRDLPCIEPIIHSISTKDRRDHGIDFIFQYDCPLTRNTQMFVLISSKMTDKYDTNPTSIFKKHLRDVAYATVCFKKSSLKTKLQNNGIRSQARTVAVIFWVDNGSVYDDVISKLSEFKSETDLEFDTVYLVDNHRVGFLYDTISFAHKYFNTSVIVEFIHPNTGLNTTAADRQTSSTILPVQYINASILPIKVIKGTDEYLFLNCIDEFDPDYLRRLISLSQKLVEGWGQQIFILFPTFNKDTFGEDVENIKLEFRDKKFIKKITISSFNPTFRNVEQE